MVLTKRYLGPVIVTTASNDPTPVELLVLTDHLGSIYALVNRSGYSLAQGMSFDAWGLRRDTDWSDFTSTELTTFFGGNTRRGYTGHEAMDETGLIHMNGRAYDPKLGRFVSADPLVQVATNTQSYNRYSYVFNNPLSYTDPTGFSAWTDFRDNILKPAGAIYISYITWGKVNTWAAGMGSVASSAIAGAAAGFTGGAIQSGTMQGAVQGAFSGAVLGAVGGMNLTPGKALFARGVAGGGISVMQGGKFGHGFVSAGLVPAMVGTGPAASPAELFGRAMAAAILGGTMSEMTGGKFMNGAWSAAFAVTISLYPSLPKLQAVPASTPGGAQPDRVAFEKKIQELVVSGDLSIRKTFETADAAATEVLNIMAPLSRQYGLEVGGEILYQDEGYTYTLPEIGDEYSAQITGNSIGYHTHPSGDLRFSNQYFRMGPGGDAPWVRSTGQPLYLGVQTNSGVKIGVCSPGACPNYGFAGTKPSRVIQ